MRKIAKFGLILFLILGSISCNAQSTKKSDVKNQTSSKVEVYYFHYTQRCNTCHAVEDNAKAGLETLYPDQVKKGDYTFTGLNLNEESGQAIAKKLEVGGQCLLVKCGENKIDITSQAFMVAHDIEKMKEEIKKAVEKVTKG